MEHVQWMRKCHMLNSNLSCNFILALLPKVTINEDSGLPETDLNTKIPLKILSQPVATTVAIFDE